MNWYHRGRLERHVVEAAKKQNPGPEHQRLEAILRQIAQESGFTQPFDLPAAVGNGLVPAPGPEIAMRDADALFLGDAKDAEHETADREESRRRIFRYLSALSRLIVTGEVQSGAFMIATNAPDAADGWATTLGLMAAFTELRHCEGKVKVFQVAQYDERTWLVF